LMEGISVILCTCDRYHVLAGCIDSLLEQSLDPDEYEILVVDNSRDLNQAREFCALYKGIDNLRYLVTDTPGLARARNFGIEYARFKYLAFIDDDALADAGWLEGIGETFSIDVERPPSVVGGPVRPIWEHPPPSWLTPEIFPLLSLIDWEADAPRPLRNDEHIVGTNMAFNGEVLKSIGGFNTDLGRVRSAEILLGNEDADAVIRMSGRGPVFWHPGAVVRHRIDSERLDKNWFRKRAAWQAVSDLLVPECKVRNRDDLINQIDDYWLKNNGTEYEGIDSTPLFQDDGANLADQLDAVYCLVYLALTGRS